MIITKTPTVAAHPRNSPLEWSLGRLAATSLRLAFATTLAVAVHSVEHPRTASTDSGTHLEPIPLPVVSAEAQEPTQADPHLVIVRGADPRNALYQLKMAGGPRVGTLGRLVLRVPAALRFTPITGRDLITAMAAAQQLQVTWVHGNRDAVLSLRAADAEIERVRSDSTSADMPVRRAAFWRAGWLQDVRIIPLLIAAARDVDAETAWVAVTALRRLGWETVCALDGSAEDLRRREFSSPDSAVRASAIGTGHLGSDASLPLLEKALADPADHVRSAAINALATMDNDQASALLEQVVADPMAYDLDFQSAVIWWFGMTKSERSIELLERLLNDVDLSLRTAILDEQRMPDDEERMKLRAGILYALARMGGERARGILERQGVWSGSDRQAFIMGGGEKALESVAKTLDEPKSSWRSIGVRSAIIALDCALVCGNVDGERVSGLLEKALADEDVEVRRSAADKAGNVGGERALDLLEKALADEDVYVRRYAVSNAGNVGGERALDLLEKALADENADVRRNAASAVGNVGGERALDLLGKALTDEDADVRRNAASAVGNVGGERALDLLEKALVDPDVTVSGEAVFALGDVGSKRALKLLEHALTNRDVTVRERAIDALENVGGERALELLEQAFTDADGTMIGALEHRVVKGLGRVGLMAFALADEVTAPHSMIAALEYLYVELLGLLLDELDDEATVRCTVIEALEDRGGEHVLGLLERALADEDSEVRSAAASALETRVMSGR